MSLRANHGTLSPKYLNDVEFCDASKMDLFELLHICAEVLEVMLK